MSYQPPQQILERDQRLDPLQRAALHPRPAGQGRGAFGNTHLAIGMSLRHCYDGEQEGVTEEAWDALGLNSCAVHQDIVSTIDRTVTAVMTDGSERVIYSGGRFQLE